MDAFEHMDGPETNSDRWILEEGDYILSIGLFRRVASEQGADILDTVNRADSTIHVRSKKEARYYFGQFTDLKRRVRKLEKAAARLF